MVKPTETEIQEFALSWLNGNKNYVADEICGRSPADAAYITGMIITHHLDRREAEGLMRAILRRIED